PCRDGRGGEARGDLAVLGLHRRDGRARRAARRRRLRAARARRRLDPGQLSERDPGNAARGEGRSQPAALPEDPRAAAARLPDEGDPRRRRPRAQPRLAAAARPLRCELDLHRRLPDDAGPSCGERLPDAGRPRVRDRGVRALTGTGWDELLAQELAERDAAGLTRSPRPLERHGAWVEREDGRRLLNLSSNDYLGLASHPAVREAAARAAGRGAGATASRLIVGTDAATSALEERLADFQGTEAALVFGSGFLANVGVVSALVGSDDAVFSDRLNHASII